MEDKVNGTEAREDTKKLLLIEQEAIRTELREAQARVKSFRQWIIMSISIAGGVAAVIVFVFLTFARADQVDAHEKRLTDVEKNDKAHDASIINLTREFDQEVKSQHQDIRWLMQQTMQNAIKANVRIIDMPNHEKAQP